MPPHKNRKTNGSRTLLRDAIISGRYPAGAALPSARELAKDLDISKSSVHNILKMLQEEGLIRMAPGRGAVVLEHRVENREMRRIFVRPSDVGTYRAFPVTRELLSSIACGAEKKNTEIMLSFSDSGRLTDEIVMHYGAGLIQGVVYCQCSQRELIEPLEKAGVPYVVAADTYGIGDALKVAINYRAAARNAVQYLVRRGHRHIGFIAGSRHDYLYQEMLAGFRGALAEENLELRPEWVLTRLAYEQAADQVGVVRKYLEQPALPTAVFTVRDYRARWVYQAAEQLGMSIPKDLSVLSYDGFTWKEAESAHLTTYQEPLREQGEMALALLQSWIQSGKRPLSREIEPQLIERGSVAPPRVP